MSFQQIDESGEHKEEVTLSLPVKIGRGNIVQNMQCLNIFVNGFNMDLSNAVDHVYKCELKFYGTNHKDVEKDLSRGPKNDVSNILRHQMLFDLFCTMLRSHENAFGNVQGDRIYTYAYDCGINFYSVTKILDKNQELRLEIDMNKISDKSVNFLHKNLKKITAVLLGTEEIFLNSKAAVDQALDERDRSVVQFLEILTNQMLYHHASYFVFAQKLFSIDHKNDIDVDNCVTKVIKTGMAKSVRFIGDSQEKSIPMVQVDPKKTLFFKSGFLSLYISEFLNCAEREIGHRLNNPNERKRLVKELKNLVVETTHQAKNSFFSIYDISQLNADELTFQDRDGQMISVRQYFERTYHMRMRFPEFPCVIEKKVIKADGKNQSISNCYPIEVLKVVDGQRVSLQKMTPKLTEQMIKNCQSKPIQYKQEIEKQRANAMLQSGGAPFKAFGIRINADIRTAQAEVMFPPAIVYSNGTSELPVQDRDGNNDVAWMVRNTKFLRAAGINVWVAVSFQHGVPGNTLQQFLVGLVKAAQDLGMSLPKEKHQEVIESTDLETVKQRLLFFKKNNANFVMFFTREKLDPVHDVMKFLEIETGVLTQHVSKQTVEKATSGRGAMLVYNNILQKMNLKLGGINWGLSTTRVMLGKNPSIGNKNIVGQEWLRQTRMFIGIDLSHAGPQSFFERQSGVLQSEPTIVGMAATMGHPVFIKGTYWCQEPRKTIIEKLADKVEEILLMYAAVKENEGKFPQHIIVYRGSVSEGEYAKVICKEQEFFQMAFEKIKNDHPTFREPILTIMIVQKTSNYRIIPQQINASALAVRQNVPAGTVVDRGIMHPTQTEFLLVPHKAIQGTAHPMKCVLAFDNSEAKGQPRMSLEEMEHITYYLCFAHGIVSSPVSIPAPLYSAGDLAKRGRNNWKQLNYGGDNESMASGDGGNQRYTGQPGFWTDMSESLKPHIKTKFWA